jgi:DnaJ-class molecular chaperone
MCTIIREHPEMCRTCHGLGVLADQRTSTNPYRTCPVCHGAKIIQVKETIFSEGPDSLKHEASEYSIN